MGNAEDDELLDQLAITARNKGLEGVKSDFDLPKLYRDGKLHNEDMDYFILTLFNEVDETYKPVAVPRSMKARDENGRLKKINAFARKLLKRRISESPHCQWFTLCRQSIETPIEVLNVLRDPVDALQDLINILRSAKGHNQVREADGSQMKYIKNEFRNWGQNVETNSILTFIPKTKGGLCNLVKWAKSKNKKVRASGFRHSWSDITVNDDQVLVSLLPLKQVEAIPTFQLEIDPDNEFQFIELLKTTVVEDGIKKKLCKIGAGTTNEQFRAWIVEESRKNGTWNDWWTLPLNVIMVETTFGGSNGAMCHGAGRKTTTLSDLVASIEIINSNGELQTIDDPFQLQSASGCFGMLGIVASITLKLNPLTFANLIPEKPRLALTIPPPKGFDIPGKSSTTHIMLICFIFILHQLPISFS